MLVASKKTNLKLKLIKQGIKRKEQLNCETLESSNHKINCFNRSVINLGNLIMAHLSSIFLSLVIPLVLVINTTNGLQCHICGQFNDGVGSITPCLNYTETNAHLYLKECPRKSDKFCVVSIWHYFFIQRNQLSFPKAQINIFQLKLFCCICHQKNCFFAVCLRDCSTNNKICLWR